MSSGDNVGMFSTERLLGQSGASVSILVRKPKPLVLVGWNGEFGYRSELGNDLCDFVMRSLDVALPQVRGVSIDRLPSILSTGCDVYPTNSVMYTAEGFDKALEYGDPDSRSGVSSRCFMPVTSIELFEKCPLTCRPASSMYSDKHFRQCCHQLTARCCGSRVSMPIAGS